MSDEMARQIGLIQRGMEAAMDSLGHPNHRNTYDAILASQEIAPLADAYNRARSKWREASRRWQAIDDEIMAERKMQSPYFARLVGLLRKQEDMIDELYSLCRDCLDATRAFYSTFAERADAYLDGESQGYASD